MIIRSISMIFSNVSSRNRGSRSMTDEQLLDYVEAHSKTELALFHRVHAIRVLDLAGVEHSSVEEYCEFIEWHYWNAIPYIREARARLQEKSSTKDQSVRDK